MRAGPYYGYLPDALLCAECSSTYERGRTCRGLWDGPCNSDEAGRLRRRPAGQLPRLRLRLRGLFGGTFLFFEFCINVAQEHASLNTVRDGDELRDTTSASSGARRTARSTLGP